MREMRLLENQLLEPFLATPNGNIQGILVICIGARVLRVIRTIGIGGLIEIDNNTIFPYPFHLHIPPILIGFQTVGLILEGEEEIGSSQMSVNREDECSAVNAEPERAVFDIFSEITLIRGKLDVFGTSFGVPFDISHEHISQIDRIVVQLFELDAILGSQWGPGAFLEESIFFGPLLLNLLVPGLERVWFNLPGESGNPKQEKDIDAHQKVFPQLFSVFVNRFGLLRYHPSFYQGEFGGSVWKGVDFRCHIPEHRTSLR